MSYRILVIGSLVLAGSLYAADGEAAKPAAPAKDAAVSKNSEPPAAVSKDLLKFLEVRINLRVSDMSPALALLWQLKLGDVPLTVRESKSVSEKKVTFDLVDVTLAEALRTINTKTGCQYRIVKSEIQLALPEEWAEVDAGKTSFDKLAPQEKAAAPAAEKK